MVGQYHQRNYCACFILVITASLISLSNCQEYDAIVVGGGAGGCVAAQSLLENGKKVLLLERGGERTASLFKKDLFTILNPKKNKCIETLNGGGVAVATGNCLGGATTFNQGIWIEERYDFLNSYGGLFETTNVAAAFQYVTGQVGFTATSQDNNPNGKIYIDSLLQALDNHPVFDIANVTPGQSVLPKKGIWRPHTIFRKDTGKRISADQILNRTNPNLIIRLHAEVTKVMFHNISNIPTATCVQYKTTAKKGLITTKLRKVCVKSNGRIFLAAGAFHTPILLMKSGVKENGNVYNNDQVGKNLSDKPVVFAGQIMNPNFNYTTKTVAELAAFVERNLSSGRTAGLLFEELSFGLPEDFAQFTIFDHAITQVGKRFTKDTTNLLRIGQYCLNRYNRRNIFLCKKINAEIQKRAKLFVLTAMVATPQSSGNITLSPNGAIKIDPGYFTAVDDVEAIGFGLRTAHDVTSSITGPMTPLTLYGSSGFLRNASNLTDQQIGDKVKNYIVSPHHFAGTAAVGRVVDNQLKVIGVNGLYVADASALPQTPRVNAMPSAMMIGRLAGSSFT